MIKFYKGKEANYKNNSELKLDPNVIYFAEDTNKIYVQGIAYGSSGDGSSGSSTTTSDIIVAGGPLADDITDNWPEDWKKDGNKVIPSGTSIQDILQGLFLKTETGTVEWGNISWNPQLEQPVVTLPDGPVEVGSTVAANVITKSGVSGNIRSAECNASQGYFDNINGSHQTGNKIVYKNGTTIGTLSAIYTWNGTTVTDLTNKVAQGVNTFTVKQSGITASVDKLDDTTVYASTNTKQVLKDVSATLTDSKPSDISLNSENSDTITGYYRWHAFSAASTDITATANTWNFTNTKQISSVTANPKRYIIVMVPSGFTLTKATQMNLDFKNSFESKDVTLNIGGGNSTHSYKMYYYYNSSDENTATVSDITIS